MYMSVYINRQIKLCAATKMEAALLATNVAMSLSTFTKKNLLISQLNRHFSTIRPSQLVCSRLNRVELRSLNRFGGSVLLSRGLGAVDLRRLGKNQSVQCVGSSAASFATGGGGFVGKDVNGGGGGGGGGGDGAAEGGEAKPIAANVAGAEDVSALSSDVIILDVTGMTCGGCSASVKRILESQPQVSSASVNLTTETAIVWPVSEAKVAPDWQKQLGEALANHLTSCGFKSKLRGQGAIEEDSSS